MISEEVLSQLSEAAQAQVMALQEQIKVLQEGMHAALGIFRPERVEVATRAEVAAMLQRFYAIA